MTIIINFSHLISFALQLIVADVIVWSCLNFSNELGLIIIFKKRSHLHLLWGQDLDQSGLEWL